MKYGYQFKNIKSRAVSLAARTVPFLWDKELNDIEKSKICCEWIMRMSKIYKIKQPDFVFNDSREKYLDTGGGCYIPSKNEIILYNKFSFVTLAHEFRHCLQHQAGVRMFRSDAEEDARAWSVSLYRLARPKSYKRAVNKGLLHFS